MLQAQIDDIINRALDEDFGSGDITTDILIGYGWEGKAYFLAKSAGILAGIEIAERVFFIVDPKIHVEVLIPDGKEIKPGDKIATVEGSFASILKAERTAINFLQHLSGIASETARYVEAVKGFPVTILDTRKTLPGLRMLEKYAVTMGGARNHRKNLGDGILIKDNHLAALMSRGFGLKEVIVKAKKGASPYSKVEIEVVTPEEAAIAAEAGAEIILLDNMSLEDVCRAVGLIKGRAQVEVSGGITLTNVRAVAECGVNCISVGAITHSVKALDISLEFGTN